MFGVSVLMSIVISVTDDNSNEHFVPICLSDDENARKMKDVEFACTVLMIYHIIIRLPAVLIPLGPSLN